MLYERGLGLHCHNTHADYAPKSKGRSFLKLLRKTSEHNQMRNRSNPSQIDRNPSVI